MSSSENSTELEKDLVSEDPALGAKAILVALGLKAVRTGAVTARAPRMRVLVRIGEYLGRWFEVWCGRLASEMYAASLSDIQS